MPNNSLFKGVSKKRYMSAAMLMKGPKGSMMSFFPLSSCQKMPTTAPAKALPNMMK
jgi:hypothetical protein